MGWDPCRILQTHGWDLEGQDGSSTSFPQRCIDWNRNLLKQELGLSEQDIVDIPQLFILTDSRADALFPDMVRPRPRQPCPDPNPWHRPVPQRPRCCR